MTAAYKLKVLGEIEALPHGQMGAYLRERGLYYAHIDKWRNQFVDGKLEDVDCAEPERRRKRKERSAELAALKRELLETQRKLAAAESELKLANKVLDVQKKILDLCAEKPQKRPKS